MKTRFLQKSYRASTTPTNYSISLEIVENIFFFSGILDNCLPPQIGLLMYDVLGWVRGLCLLHTHKWEGRSKHRDFFEGGFLGSGHVS